MELPEILKLKIEQLAEQTNISTLITSAAGISEKYRTESGRGKRLVTAETDILAYAIARMPATYGAVSSVLTAHKAQAKTVLDIGAGTGAASWAALGALDGIESITCIEREALMMSLGEKLMDDNRVHWVNADMRSFKCETKFDMVIASYSLNELAADDLTEVCGRLWNLTGETLIIIDPGTPEAFLRIKAIRNYLIKCGAHAAAPCPHDDDCPLSEDDWCHFTCRIARSKLHKLLKGGDAPYEDEKFTYLVLTRTKPNAAGWRVIRHPQIDSGRITLRLCTQNGLETRVVTKKQKDEFRIARKLKCGDSFH